MQVGILKTTVPAKNCLLVKGKAKVNDDLRPKKRKGYAHDMLVTRTATTRQELDVRGMTIEEAIPTVDKGIDDALLGRLARPAHHPRQRHRRFAGGPDGLSVGAPGPLNGWSWLRCTKAGQERPLSICKSLIDP